jgi:hypothetical protein
MSRLISSVIGSLLLASGASADVQIRFIESAPKDRFVFENTGDCALTDLQVAIDLANSNGKLIFDTTGAGAGVEVYQPFEVRDGEVALQGQVRDGDTQLQITIAQLAIGERASFTIDVDDTLKNSALGNIRVAGSEIASGQVNLSVAGAQPINSVFSDRGIATVTLGDC